jgi:hypothetical protein
VGISKKIFWEFFSSIFYVCAVYLSNMKSYIKKLLRESLLNETESMFKSITNIPDYDKLKDGKYNELPSKYSNMSARVVNMSPEQYFKYCAKIQGTTYEQQFSYLRKVVVDKLIGLMDGGVKMDMPYLNFIKGDTSQEGRHRAKAAMDLGITSIPVLIIDRREGDEDAADNTLSSKIGVWDDLTVENGNYYISYDIKNWSGSDSLLSSIRPNYDVYLLDSIFDTYVYRRLYPDLLSIVNDVNGGSMSEYVSNGLDAQNFLNYLPDEYKSRLNIDWDDYTDEEYDNYRELLDEVKPTLVKLALLFILMHNESEINSVIKFDYSNGIASLFIDGDIDINNDYGSGKKMLLDYQIYDDLDLYSVEDDDYYKMSEKFIKTYFNKV